MARRATRALTRVHVDSKRPQTLAAVECLLTDCDVCGKSIAHEDTHACQQLSPEHRQARAASRAHKATELRAAGIAIRDERSTS